MADNDKRGGERVPAALRLKLRYTNVETFIDKYAANVSKGGIFIASRAPKPVGTVLRFEFQLADGAPVVRGEGKVVWVKEFDPAHPQKPHGMGLKFTRLDRQSRGVLERMLAHKGQPRGEGSGMSPLPAESSAPRPMPAEGSGPLPTESSAPRPIPAEGARSEPELEGSSPEPRPPAPTVPITIALDLETAVEELERLAGELGFTEEALIDALVRARALAAGANGDLEAFLNDPAAAETAPLPAPAPRPPAPPLAPGAARAAAMAPSFDQEETTDVDRAQREAHAAEAAAARDEGETTGVDLGARPAPPAAPPVTAPPDAEPPRKGRLGAVVKKILGD